MCCPLSGLAVCSGVENQVYSEKLYVLFVTCQSIDADIGSLNEPGKNVQTIISTAKGRERQPPGRVCFQSHLMRFHKE